MLSIKMYCISVKIVPSTTMMMSLLPVPDENVLD